MNAVWPANIVALRYRLEVVVRLMFHANGSLCNLWHLKLLAARSAYKDAYIEAKTTATSYLRLP